MAGILKQGGGTTVLRTLSLPAGEEGWDVHAFAKEGPAEVHSAASCQRLPQGTLVALPTSRLLVLPLWLQTADPILLHGLVSNQLERLRPFAEENVEWAYLPVGTEEGKTLVAVYLLPPSLPEDLLVPQASGYDFAVRCLALPQGGCLLIREAEGITFVCVRENRLAYAHHFPGSNRVAEISSDLAGTTRWLVMEQIVADPRPCILRGDFLPEDLAAAEALFGSARLETVQPIRFPEPSLTLLPSSLRTARQTAAARSRQLRMLQLASVVYLLLLAGAAFDLFRLSEKAHRIASDQAAQAGTVTRLHKASDRWHALQPAIDPDYYPLQALLATVNAMPPEIRLTQFGHTTGKILLAGEGKNAAVIFAFLKTIQGDPLLKQWKWVMPQPQILPSNRAQFQMEGTRP